MFTQRQQTSMEAKPPRMLSQEELAARWGVSVVLIGLYSAVGLGPKYVREGGYLRFPVEEVQKYEHARLMH
jgi:predicted site-specific integrase-resolvase